MKSIRRCARGLLLMTVWTAGEVAGTPAGAAESGVDLASLENWDIVLADDAIASERYAAEELRDHFARASGVELPIVSGSERTDRHIFVGASAAMRRSPAGFSTDGMGEEELRIVVRSGNIAIAGGRPRGTLYGVYTFLEDYVGVRFLTPDHTYVPPIGEWRVVGPLDRAYRPPLAFRWSYYGETNRNPAFAARLRCNTVPRDAKFGGITSRRLISHSFAYQIPSRRYGEEHPEYYSLVEGRRLAKVNDDSRETEPCLTHPDVLEIVTRSVLEALERHPEWSNVSVSQNDNAQYCRCERCAALDEREGTPMGSLLAFVNAVASEVAKVHPNVKVGTLSYWYTRQPPRTLRPAPNVQIQLSSIECSQMQPLSDSRSALNEAFCRDMQSWGSICDDICIWTYMTNFHNYLLPCPNLHVIEPNIRFFVAHNARGAFMQGAGNALGAELSAVRNYITSRLLWNPNLSGDALIDEFLRLHYGRAAPAVRAFIDVVHRNAIEKRLEKNCFGRPSEYGIDEEVAQSALGAIESALLLAETSVVRDRVEKVSIGAYRAAVGDLPLRLSGGLRARWRRGEVTSVGTLDPEAARKARPYMRRLLELARKHGVTHWSENWTIDDALPLLKRFFGLEENETF